MDSTRWPDLEREFERLSVLEPGAREARIAILAKGDVEFARELESLLEAAERVDGRIDDLPLEASGKPTEPFPEVPPGLRLGPYELVRLVGSGGMGVVYEGQRADGYFERRVAIKFLHARIDDAVAAQRFVEEGSLLARLDDPNTVSLLDAGVFEGYPYLVMELVEGRDLATYVREVGPDRAARIALLRGVVSAVAAAHRRLVLHLDLKPSNVIVGATGTPKLVDFGVALMIGGRATRGAGGPQPLTPAYASPEQLCGDEPTTASDVFALGRMLAELVPDGDRTEDLAAVIACATATDPAARYGSVDRLDDDLRRFQQGFPVEVRPRGGLQRAFLWTRRNRLLAAALAAAVLGLGLAGNATLRSLELARASEVLGWRAHAQALHFAGLLERALLELPVDERSRALIDDLEREANAAFERWGDLPEAVGRTREALARARSRLGDRAVALDHANRALVLARSDLGFDRNDIDRLERLVAELGGG